MIVIRGIKRNRTSSAILAILFLFTLITSKSPSTIGATVPIDSFAQGSSPDVNSYSIVRAFDTGEKIKDKMNTTMSGNQSNSTERVPESSNNPFIKNQSNHDNDVLSTISTARNISGIINTAPQGPSGLSADFNGDGYNDLAIGVPFENEETGGTIIMDLPITAVTASGNDGNVPQNVLDGNLGTRWSSLGVGQSITADLGSSQEIGEIQIAWYKGDVRQYHFVVDTSSDGIIFMNIVNRDTTGTTTNFEKYTIPAVNARYLRVTVNGNSQNNWASITELDIYGPSPSDSKVDSGAVNIIYGSSKGLAATAISSGNGGANQIWRQSIDGSVEPGDLFGSALATGDFNKDGYSDLAIGVPREDVGTIADAGAVNIIYGSSEGLSSTAISVGNGRADQIWTQNTIGYPAKSADGDLFGSALATGDFNKDGISDLAIGVPREDVNTHYGFKIDAGAVDVIYGSLNGLNSTRSEEWTQYTPLLGFWWNDTELNDHFGSSLTTGDFNKDGYSDLAIGVPGEDIGSVLDAGQVNVIYYGVSTGAGVFLQTWTQDSTGIEDAPDNDDEFSTSLTTGDFNKDGYSDLAIGVPGENAGPIGSTVSNAGAVNVIYGSSGGLWPTNNSVGNGRTDQIWTQDSPGIEDYGESEDAFGYTLTTGDFNKDGITDLAIGVPREDVGTIADAGAVNIIYGSSEGLSSTAISVGNGRADQIWTQNSTNVDDDAEFRDLFGFALTTGDFNKDGITDLAIGVPLENVGTPGYAGAVNVLYGSVRTEISIGGLSATVPVGGIGRADQIWTQDSAGIRDSAEGGDQFGSALG